MTWQPLLPIPALAVIIGLLALVCGWQIFRGGARTRWTWVRRLALAAVVGVMGLGPAVATTTQAQVANVDVFFVVDRTGSMAAEDYNGTHPRLDGVKADLVSLATDIPGARYSIISFDSQASRQLPLTTDTRAISAWAQTLKQEISAYSQGSLTDRPLDELTAALTGSATAHPANTRVVFFMSDGEQTASGTPRSYAPLKELVDAGAVLGYGTAEGGRMKEYDPQADPGETGYIKDITQPGDPDAISKIDEKSLQTTAEQLGVEYVHRESPTPTAGLVKDIDPQLIAEDGRRDINAYRLMLWPFALAMAALLAWEAWGWASAMSLARPNRQARGMRDERGMRDARGNTGTGGGATTSWPAATAYANTGGGAIGDAGTAGVAGTSWSASGRNNGNTGDPATISPVTAQHASQEGARA